MEQWGNICTAGDPNHSMGMHSCASSNHFYESSLLQTTWYVEFQGTGVGDGLHMYLGLCKDYWCIWPVLVYTDMFT